LPHHQFIIIIVVIAVSKFIINSCRYCLVTVVDVVDMQGFICYIAKGWVSGRGGSCPPKLGAQCSKALVVFQAPIPIGLPVNL